MKHQLNVGKQQGVSVMHGLVYKVQCLSMMDSMHIKKTNLSVEDNDCMEVAIQVGCQLKKIGSDEVVSRTVNEEMYFILHGL